MRFLPLFVAMLLAFSPIIALADVPQDQQYVSSRGNEYTVSYDQSTELITVVVTNTNDRKRKGSFRVEIDRWYWKFESFTLPAGGKTTFSYNLTEGFDVTRNTHSVKFSAGPDPLWFNYTKDVDPKTTTEYPTPTLTNVTLREAMFRGQERTVIDVSGRNPSGRDMTLVVRAHTMETTGHYGILSLPAHGTGNETIILKERAGELVAGEVRMYDGNFSSDEGAFEQVEIYGRSTGSTSWNRERYETVTPPWEDDAYVYENQSAYRDKVSPDTAAESPVLWVVGAVVLLGAVFFYRRR